VSGAQYNSFFCGRNYFFRPPARRGFPGRGRAETFSLSAAARGAMLGGNRTPHRSLRHTPEGGRRMRATLFVAFLVFVSLLTPTAPLAQDAKGGGHGLDVLGFKWSKSRQTVERADGSPIAPQPAMTAGNRNFERNRRVNDPVGARDPNAETLDARSAALEKNVREALSPKLKTVEGYEYSVKFRNAGARAVEVLFWEYRFAERANTSNVARRQFLCGVMLKPGKEKQVRTFGVSGPSVVVSAGTLAGAGETAFDESVVVNRVEYSDGTIWQRRDWNFAEVRESIKRATSTPWGAEMCRAL
jgi:hypothetical protein